MTCNESKEEEKTPWTPSPETQPRIAVERIRHLYDTRDQIQVLDSQGQILALAFRFFVFELSPLRSEVDRKTCAAVHRWACI